MMRRFMLIVAALVFASPVMAVVDVNAVQVSDGVAITYGGGADVRAFALNITVDNGATITGISGFFSGEGAGYGIFPGSFRECPINPADPNWDDPNYTPVAPSGDPDAGDDIPGADITIELGALYDGEANKPPVDGNLCVLQIDAPNGNCNVCIEVNVGRGKVVKNNASEAATNLPICRNILFDCYTGPYPDEWAAVGKPDCWCASVNPRQCHGDADGRSQGKGNYWAASWDLEVLVAAWSKSYAAIAGQTVVTGGGDAVPLICADFDHLPQGKGAYRVASWDLEILVANWSQANLPLPDCP